MLTSLRNKSVIVTGGTKGIGKGIAGVFIKLGARVCVIGRSEHDGAAAAAASPHFVEATSRSSRIWKMLWRRSRQHLAG
jgi:NAD(P)-dependent dehydrogenase (short-subunit alcohol dehydrogenase family)